MKKLLLLAFTIFFFSSCASNSAYRYFDKTNMDTEILQNTKKADIIKNQEPKVIFLATYLNNVKKYKKLENDTFIINIFFTGINDSQDIQKNNYTLSLNGKKAINMVKLDKTNKEYKNFFLKNTWGKYYLVEFKTFKKNDKLTLKLSDNTSFAKLVFER